MIITECSLANEVRKANCRINRTCGEVYISGPCAGNPHRGGEGGDWLLGMIPVFYLSISGERI